MKEYYWQCRYYTYDYINKKPKCTRCPVYCYDSFLCDCLMDKCDKIEMRNGLYEVKIDEHDRWSTTISLVKK